MLRRCHICCPLTLTYNTFVSLQEFTRSEINASDDRLVQKLDEEKKRRETVLELRHAMAKEVTMKSKESQEGRAWI